MLTLWETRRKNLQEKDKNDLDHARQVKAERRSRYAKAIEQLGDDNTSIKLGGIYTLSKLIDEWLEDDKTTPITKERKEEGQIIINNLAPIFVLHLSLPIHTKFSPNKIHPMMN